MKFELDDTLICIETFVADNGEIWHHKNDVVTLTGITKERRPFYQTIFFEYDDPRCYEINYVITDKEDDDHILDEELLLQHFKRLNETSNNSTDAYERAMKILE